MPTNYLVGNSIIFILMEITLKLLGGRLKEICKALDMLQEDVAKHLDVNQNAISRIENGEGERHQRAT